MTHVLGGFGPQNCVDGVACDRGPGRVRLDYRAGRRPRPGEGDGSTPL